MRMQINIDAGDSPDKWVQAEDTTVFWSRQTLKGTHAPLPSPSAGNISSSWSAVEHALQLHCGDDLSGLPSCMRVTPIEWIHDGTRYWASPLDNFEPGSVEPELQVAEEVTWSEVQGFYIDYIDKPRGFDKAKMYFSKKQSAAKYLYFFLTQRPEYRGVFRVFQFSTITKNADKYRGAYITTLMSNNNIQSPVFDTVSGPAVDHLEFSENHLWDVNDQLILEGFWSLTELQKTTLAKLSKCKLTTWY